MYSATFKNRVGYGVTPERELRFTPLRWSGHAVGGPLRCEIGVSGPASGLWRLLEWLRYGVEVHSERGTRLWWGMVQAVAVESGGLRVGWSLDSLYNRVRVAYSMRHAGRTSAGRTEWVQDDTSVEEFGLRELLHSAGRATREASAQLAGQILAEAIQPRGVPSVGGGASGEARATLSCVGWWSTLSWRYYSQQRGLIAVDEEGSQSQPIGVELASSEIGFEANNDRVLDIEGRLGVFRSGHSVRVSGSASNDGTYPVVRGTNQEAERFTASHISFDPSDDIKSPEEDLGFVDANDLIHVDGSTLNDGFWFVERVQDDSQIETIEKTIETEAAGQPITIRKATGFSVDGSLTTELPGAPVALEMVGGRLAQRVVNPSGEAWPVGEIVLQVSKSGAPTDSLRVSLWTDANGEPGTELGSTSILGEQISDRSEATTFALSPVKIGENGARVVVVERTGQPSHEHYFEVERASTSGAIKLWNGESWVDGVGALKIEVWGAEETSEQVAEIVRERGQFLEGATVVEPSGVRTRQFQDGTRRAGAVAESLLAHGAADGRRMAAEVLPERVVAIQPERPRWADNLLLSPDGELKDVYGSRIEPGVLPYGYWLRLTAVPPEVESTLQVSPIYLEQVEFDAGSGQYRFVPRGAKTPGDIGRIDQG